MKFMLVSMVVFLALVLPVTTLGQSQIGVVGGINFANIHVENEDFEYVTKYGFGAVLELRLSDALSLCAEPMYLMGGTRQALGPVTLRVDHSAISVPLFLKLNILSDEFRPYVMTGPFISFRLNSEFGYETINGTFTGDAGNIIKGSDFGVGFGGGLSYALAGIRIFVEGRYSVGLVDVSNAGAVQLNVGNQVQIVPVGDVDATTRGIQIMAGVAFPIGS